MLSASALGNGLQAKGATVKPATSQAAKVEKPAQGSKLRKAILDGLRPSIEKDLGQKVVFIVQEIRVYDGWAFVECRPVQPTLKPIDFMKTKYRVGMEEGGFDGDHTFALLRTMKGKWATKAFVIGPTDVAWISWMDTPLRAPKRLFPPPYGPK